VIGRSESASIGSHASRSGRRGFTISTPWPVRSLHVTADHGHAARLRSLHFRMLLLAVLAGLFAMHGLGPHGEDHSAGHVPGLVAAALPGHGDALHGNEHAAHELPSTAGHAATVDSAPTDEGGPGLGECLALLGLLLWLVIAVVLAARPRRPMVVLPRTQQRLLLLGRLPDRPCLHRLSILRC
jgi:hypothetical protein